LSAAGAYRHPRPGLAGRLLARLLNARGPARLRRALFARLPFLVLRSDVRDVVYVTWMVDAGAARALLPHGLPLWERDGKTPFTVLTYRHGHFGPARAGPLRRLFPSPLQSNWRLYLAEPAGSVYFVGNVMDSAAYVAGTRLFSDVMQTHLPARFAHGRAGEAFRTVIESGQGSAPALAHDVVPAARVLPPAFARAFGSWEQAVAMLACQDLALGWSDRLERLMQARIALPIPLDKVQAMAPVGEVECALLERLPPAGAPLCFLVPAVRFSVLSET
jgi:hypothetical protein